MLLKILALVVVIAGLGVFLFYTIIFPIWTIIHCASSETRSRKSKILWMIFLFLFIPVSNIIYGIFASGKKFFKWVSGTAIVFFIVVGIGLFFLLNVLSKYQAIATDDMISNFQNNTDTKELSAEELNGMNENLEYLKANTKANIFKYDTFTISSDLTRFLAFMIKDKKFSKKEYDEWILQFNNRKVLNRLVFEQYVNNYIMQN